MGKEEGIDETKKELNDKIAAVKANQKEQTDVTYESVCGSAGNIPKIKPGTKRQFKGHINKVNCVHFAGDSRHLVSGSLDGKLIIWDIATGNKTQIIPLLSAWVMSCTLSPTGNFVASGGMDNACTVHDLNNRDANGVAKVCRELLGYEGFLSCSRFLEDGQLLTGSGDMKVMHWNLDTGDVVHEWFGHSGDVATMSLSPDKSCFLTGSVDRTVKLWDLRDPKECKQTFWGHKSDVNSVCFHPSGYAFVTAAEDKSARLWDIRSDQQVAEFKPPTANSGFTSCGLSKSGRILFAGSDDNMVHMWDVLKQQHMGTMQGHDNRITSLAMCDAGFAIATSSWDNNVRVWGI